MSFLAPHAAWAVTIVSPSHPHAIYYSFNDGKAPFEPFTVPGGVPSGARFAVEGGALKLTNAFAGSFSVDTKIKPFNADDFSHVYFDYKLNPDVKVNFFVRVNEKFHGVTFSGPDSVRPGAIRIGKIADVRADGQWHRAHIPLRDWLRKVDPIAPALNVDMMLIGNWDNTGWLMAGIGGNGPGATWWVDNFSIVGAGPGEAKLELRDDKGEALPTPPTAKWLLDGNAAGDGPQVTLSAADGFHMVEARDAAGKTLANYPLFTAPSAPKIGAARLTGNTLRVPISAPGGLKLSDVKLTVDGRDFDLNSVHLAWDGAAGELLLDAARAGLVWKDGAKVSLALSGVSDVQNRAAPAWQGEVTVDYGADKEVPALPKLQIEGVEAPRAPRAKRNEDLPLPIAPAPIFGAGDGTFEEGMDEWTGNPDNNDAILERDPTTAASGQYSLRLTCPQNAARFLATIRTSGFDAAKVPVVSFDYKITPQLRADFMLLFDGKNYSVQFTDKDNPWPRLGTVPNVVADGKWHHTEFNLGAMLREVAPGRPSYRVDSFYIGDGGWMGNARNVQYWFDNFQFVPLAKGAPLHADASLNDVTGLKAISWTLDDKRDTEPSPVATGTTAQIEATGNGRKWLHVRAQNGAGQWGPALHVPLWLSEGAPQVLQAEVVPAPGARTVPTTLEIPLRAEGDIALDSVRLTVAGQDFTAQDAALKYDKARGKLVWNAAAALAAGQMQPQADAARVEWKLHPVRDFLGHEAPAVEGHWINDFAQDKSGPAVLVTSLTHSPYFSDNAEAGAANWEAQPGARVAQVERAAGDHALRFTNETAGGEFVVAAQWPAATGLWIVKRHSLIRFDYRIPPEVNLAIRLKFANGRSWYLQVAGEKTTTILGTIPDIVADNQWHTATVDLADFLQRDQNLRDQALTDFEFRDPTLKTPARASWEMDNFIVQQSGKGPVKLAWQANDLSGVKGYRFAWDQLPATAPQEATTDAQRTLEAQPGLWFAHLQAQDGAGNWGAPTHTPIVVQ